MDRSVRRAVLERLAAVEEMALRAGSPVPDGIARAHLKTITDSWRKLLIKHQPDLKGRCPVCSGWLRRRRWPCQVWVTAHEHLIGDAPGPTAQPDKKSIRSRRPRQVEVIPRQVGVPAAADQTRTDHDGIRPTPRSDQPAGSPTGYSATPAEHEPSGHVLPEQIPWQLSVPRQPSVPRQLSADDTQTHRATIAESEPTIPCLPRNRRPCD